MIDQFAAALAFGRFDIPNCWAALKRMAQSKDTLDQSKSLAMQACLMAEQHNWDDAAALLREGANLDARNGLGTHQVFTKDRLLAQLSLRRGRRGEAIEHCRVALDRKLDQADTMQTGCLLAQAGDVRAARRCLVDDLPDWPCYQHWAHRLQAEIALASGDSSRALTLLQSAPPPLYVNEWPEPLVRAALAVGDRETARQHIQNLIQSPAQYFFQIDVTGPGFISWASERASELGLPATSALRASALKSALLGRVS
jgi:hypothetical protein